MLENELNDAEPSGEERSGARSPQINTAAAEGPPPADDAPAAKGRRADRRPAKASGTDAAAPDAPPRGPGGASAGPDAAGPSAIHFASPAAEAPAATGAPARAAEPAGTAARAGTAAPAATGAPAGTGTPAGSGTPAGGVATGAAERSAVPAATFQPPQVIFQPPPQGETGDAGARGRKAAGAGDDVAPAGGRGRGGAGAGDDVAPAGGRGRGAAGAGDEGAGGAAHQSPEQDDGEPDGQGRRRRRRGSRSRGQGADTEPGTDAGEKAGSANGQGAAAGGGRAAAAANGEDSAEPDAAEADEDSPGRRRRRRRRRSSGQDADQAGPDEPPNTVVHVRAGRSGDEPAGEVQSVRGSTRLEAKRQRRREGRDSGRRRPPIITESEFLARREAVDRVMVVRQRGERTQIGVLEDGVLVEHYVDKASHQSFVGNVYLGKVQNVLPSMEAAFVDIGKGRNAVL